VGCTPEERIGPLGQAVTAISLGAALMFGGIVFMLILWIAIIGAFFFRSGR
jgi:hypothetical protein